MKKRDIYIILLSCIIISFALPCPVSSLFEMEAKAAVAKKNTKKSSSKKKAPAKKSTGKKNTTNRKRSTGKKRTNTKKKTSSQQNNKPQENIKNDALTLKINEGILNWIPSTLNPGGLRVNSVTPVSSEKNAVINLNENFTYLPVTSDFIKEMKEHVETLLPDSLHGYELNFKVGDKNYAYYISTIDKLPEEYRKNPPFVLEAEPYVKVSKGMGGDIVAMWPSHGRYFKPGSGAWYWQRPQLFQVTEDTHTMSYIYPYVVPMIENAGGYVMLPRERDFNKHEIIVDNDTNEEGQIFSQPYYKEKTGNKKWTTGEGEGFIYDLPDFRDTENPFVNGTYRQVETIKNGKPSVAAWYADIPADGEYSVYVSYKTLPNSIEDARYKVIYSGGEKEFLVNQTMGGGTWIYLGTFPFEAGFSEEEPIVLVSNISSKEGKILTADAVKIGGGMGNISRSDSRSDVYIDPSTPVDLFEDYINGLSSDTGITEDQIKSIQTLRNSGYTPSFSVSGLPRFLEGARYWLHWAGMPEEIYSPYHGTDDYKDDYTSRGLWVNYLAGGSRVLPGRKGLNIPIDVTMALHSDAGVKNDDSFIGTLGIYFTNNGDLYADGTPRANSRSFTDMLIRQITMDIRQTWEPNWTRRAMWDKTYVEARVPEVPTSLIEFMSHQNFADMKYALDPSFRFTVGRAIYKAIGRFIAERKDKKFVVQPLPVKNFSIEKEKKGNYKLRWQPTDDPLEPTAKAEKYIILERTGDQLGFHKIGETSSTHFNIKISDNYIHSFKVLAANDGGVSFPSEILAMREDKSNQKPILIINGFDRVSGPANYSTPDQAGFLTESDFGVPYIKDVSFIGYQTEFNRNPVASFGKSNGNYASTIIGGNTFDYPYLHGKSLEESGRSFVSTSAGAVANGEVNLSDYETIDLILGKQKTTIIGNGYSGKKFKTFPSDLQKKIKDFIAKGGNIIITGAYVASDLTGEFADVESLNFANNTLGITNSMGARPLTGQLRLNKGVLSNSSGESTLNYNNFLNEKNYIVENPDILRAVDDSASKVFMTFSDTGEVAGLAINKGKSKLIISSIPFESINESERTPLMKQILSFIEK